MVFLKSSGKDWQLAAIPKRVFAIESKLSWIYAVCRSNKKQLPYFSPALGESGSRLEFSKWDKYENIVSQGQTTQSCKTAVLKVRPIWIGKLLR